MWNDIITFWNGFSAETKTALVGAMIGGIFSVIGVVVGIAIDRWFQRTKRVRMFCLPLKINRVPFGQGLADQMRIDVCAHIHVYNYASIPTAIRQITLQLCATKRFCGITIRRRVVFEQIPRTEEMPYQPVNGLNILPHTVSPLHIVISLFVRDFKVKDLGPCDSVYLQANQIKWRLFPYPSRQSRIAIRVGSIDMKADAEAVSAAASLQTTAVIKESDS